MPPAASLEVTYQEEYLLHPLRRALERKIEIQERSLAAALRDLQAKRCKKKGSTVRQRLREEHDVIRNTEEKMLSSRALR